MAPALWACCLLLVEMAVAQQPGVPVDNSRTEVSADNEGESSLELPPSVVSGLQNYCVDCHAGPDATAGLDLDTILAKPFTTEREVWESVARRLRARQMPPADAYRPAEAEYTEILQSLEAVLDKHADQYPLPGRSDTFRRLTRSEYQFAIRDLLGLHIEAADFLPSDEVSHGFDNITVGELSPTLLNRYISAAQRISRLALGRPLKAPEGRTVRVRPDLTQEQHVPGLPFGTRGGVIFEHHFPVEGEYEIRIRLTRDRNEHVEGLSEPHQLELLLDRGPVQSFTVKPPRGSRNGDEDGAWSQATHENVDRHLVARMTVSAGPHKVGATFVKNPTSLLETKRQPLHVHYNMYRHPRIGPAIYQVSITGPFDSQRTSETPSRKRILICQPSASTPSTGAQSDVESEEGCARVVIANLLRRACRRPINEEDLARPLALYREVRGEGGDFEAGIEMALASILMHPEFLFRVERDPDGLPPNTPYRLSDVELASRLSFFLWSSIPDEELLSIAEQGRLSEPTILTQQVLRMLSDDRSQALVQNFAGQWLYLRNLDAVAPDLRLYPDFDDNLRQAFRRETELFFESIIRDDRSVLDLLRADYTFLNERLARHYGIPHVVGSRFRRVVVGDEGLKGGSVRGGLLRQGSILTVTSYATRTSPVIRGKWILENILGIPPPPPPPDVPALESSVSAELPVRERLAQHRADPACASCHDLIDPVGFALENFDALGKWRETDSGQPVDASGGLPDGSQFSGVDGLERALLERPELFVATFAEKLLTYALGRGLEYYDAPAVRQIVRESRHQDFRFSSLILGIVRSTPFQMRMTR